MTKLTPEPVERAWVDIDLAGLVRNARRFAALVGGPLLPMLKADGYGLGATRVAGALEHVDPWGYGVASSAEGAELRAAGITRPIIVFTPLLPDPAILAATRRHGLRPVIGDLAALDGWLAAAGEPFHVEIDTGMSRSGFRWNEPDVLEALRERLVRAPGWEGAFTHFHSADRDPDSAREQAQRLETVLRCLGKRPPLVHLANSAAAGFPTVPRGDLARPGIYLYGGRAGALRPEPVASLRARVVALRRLRRGDTVSYGAEGLIEADTTIATLAIGYADGVPRALSGRGRVELGDAVVPVVGRVTMDMLMVAVADAPVKLGDVATLFGGRVSLDEQAELAGTVSYELLSRLTPRVARRYHES